MEHTCLSTFILCLNLFLKLITSQRKHNDIFREVKPEPLKLFLFKNLGQVADIFTNESCAMVKLKLLLHKSGNCWVCSDGLAGGCLYWGHTIYSLLNVVCTHPSGFQQAWSETKSFIALHSGFLMRWWEVSGGAGGTEAGSEGPHCTWEKNKAPSSGKHWRVLLFLVLHQNKQVLPHPAGLWEGKGARGLGTKWPLSSFPTQPFCDSTISGPGMVEGSCPVLVQPVVLFRSFTRCWGPNIMCVLMLSLQINWKVRGGRPHALRGRELWKKHWASAFT